MIDGVGSIKVHVKFYNFGITFISVLEDKIKTVILGLHKQHKYRHSKSFNLIRAP